MKPNRSRLCGLLVGFTGLTIGIWVGFPAPDASVDGTSKPNRIFKSERRATAQPVERQRTFEQLVKRWHRSGRVPVGVAEWIDRSSSREIQAEMLELAGLIRDDGAWRTNFNLYQILKAMAVELVRREGDKALDWCVSTGSPPLMEVVAAALTEARPANLHRYRERHPERFAELGSSLFAGATNGAAMKGAAELLQQNDNTAPYDLEFATDFDFDAYLRNTKNRDVAKLAFATWAARDPDAAAEAFFRRNPGNSVAGVTQFAAAFEGQAAMAGEEAAAAWAAALPFSSHPEIRKWQIESFVERGMMKSRIDALLEHFPTETDRLNFAVASLGGFQLQDNAISAIAGNESEEFKAQVILGWGSPERIKDPLFRKTETEKLMEDFQISAGRREAIRKELSAEGN